MQGKVSAKSAKTLPSTASRSSFTELARQSSRGSAFNRSWPMWVLPVSEALQLNTLRTHEELMAEGKLVQWEEGMGPVAFFSQTWLSAESPDNTRSDKCSLLREVLLRAVLGKLDVRGHFVSALAYGSKKLHVPARQLREDLRHGFVWFDVISVPQTDKQAQANSISSLTSYVADSAYFFVLAGPWRHEVDGSLRDFRAWLERGWCRCEQLANALSLHWKPLIVVQSADDVQSYGGGLPGRMWLYSPVGLGVFTNQEDRRKLYPVLSDLIDARRAAAKAAGSAEEHITFRVLHACKPHLLRGLGGGSFSFEGGDDGPALVQRWLRELEFTSVCDGEETGWTPLRLAVLAGYFRLAEALLDAGADVEAPVRQGRNDLGVPQGTTILHTASYCRDDPRMVRLLLARGADPRRYDTSRMRFTAMHYACAYGRVGNLDALAAHDVTLFELTNHPKSAVCVYPLAILSIFGQAAALRHAMWSYADRLNPSSVIGPGLPSNYAVLCLQQIGDLQTLAALLDHGFDHTRIWPLKHRSHRKLLIACDLVVRLSRKPKALFEAYAYGTRATALHAAALTNNLGAVNLLLSHGAPSGACGHSHNMTPLHLAALKGYTEVAEALLSAGASALALDCRGRTPGRLAKWRGHIGLAERLRFKEVIEQLGKSAEDLFRRSSLPIEDSSSKSPKQPVAVVALPLPKPTLAIRPIGSSSCNEALADAPRLVVV